MKVEGRAVCLLAVTTSGKIMIPDRRINQQRDGFPFFSLGHGKEIKLLSKEPNGLDFARNGIILRGPSVGALLLERLYVWIGEGLLGGVGRSIWW